jgi:hypothetical protein
MRIVYHGSVEVRAIAALAVACASCGASLSAPSAWSTPTPVPGASDPSQDTDNETLDTAMTEMYFTIVDNTINNGTKQMWTMSRASVADAWGAPKRLDVVNTPMQTESPRLSPDDLTLYFGRNGNIYTSTRTAVGQPWGTPSALASVNTGAYVKWMAVCDGDYFVLSRDNGSVQGQDLFEGKLGEAGSAAMELNSRQDEISSFLSKDCLTLYFASNRAGSIQMYTATRTSPTSTWSTPSLVTDFGMAPTNKDGWLSDDEHTFYFASIRDGDMLRAVYMSTR